MSSSLDGSRTYFQNRITEEFLMSLLASGNSFFLENVSDLDGTAALCEAALTQRGIGCRIEDRRVSWAQEAVTFLPWPLKLFVGAWALAKDAMRRFQRRRANVVIVKRLGALHIQFR